MNAKRIILSGLFFLLSVSSYAQTVNDIFDPKVPVTWLGLDFSAALLIGDRERYGSESDVKSLLVRWNDLMEAEKAKFDVALMIGRVNVDYKLNITKDHNADLDVSSFLTDKTADHIHIRKDDIPTIVNSYDFENLKGIGLMFNIESFNKTNNEALLWVTFIDLATKEVLLTEKLSAPPGGFGVRNYWAGAVFAIITKVQKKEFENWRKKYQLK